MSYYDTEKYGSGPEVYKHLKALQLLQPNFLFPKYTGEFISECKESYSKKVLHFIRHAIGTHNEAASKYKSGCICPDKNCAYKQLEHFDAYLTEAGKDQARGLVNITKMYPVELVVVSPLSRAIQTALLAYDIENNKVPMIALECLREQYGQHICDKRKNVSDLKKEFPMVDFSLMKTDIDDKFNEIERESKESVVLRCRELMDFIKNRPEKNIAIVSHSSYFFALFYAVIEVGKATWFKNCELRSIAVDFESNNL